jgi:hypothetical protein
MPVNLSVRLNDYLALPPDLSEFYARKEIEADIKQTSFRISFKDLALINKSVDFAL